MSTFKKQVLCETAIGSMFSVPLWFDLSRFLVPQTQFGNPLFETPFHGTIAIIPENLNAFGTPFQKVFCHSAKSRPPLAEYFSSCKALKSSDLLRQKKVFCHSAKAQRKAKKEEW
jgi:hypothetical protein